MKTMDAQIQNGDLVLLDLGAQKTTITLILVIHSRQNGTFPLVAKNKFILSSLKALKETTEIITARNKVQAVFQMSMLKKYSQKGVKAVGLIQEDEELSNIFIIMVSAISLGLDTIRKDVGTYKDRVN